MLVPINLFLVTLSIDVFLVTPSIDGVSGVSSARTTTILFTSTTESSSVLIFRLLKIYLAPRAYPKHHSAQFACRVWNNKIKLFIFYFFLATTGYCFYLSEPGVRKAISANPRRLNPKKTIDFNPGFRLTALQTTGTFSLRERESVTRITL